MSEDHYRRRIASLQRDKAKLEDKAAQALRKAAKHDSEANRAESGITKHTSATSAQQKMKKAASEREKAAKERETAARNGEAAAKKGADIASAQASLQREVDRRLKKESDAQRKELKARDDDRKAQEKFDRKRRDEELRHARTVARAAEHRVEVREIHHVVTPAPAPQARILVLAASPTDQTPLRLGAELRDIRERVRMSEHRDSLDLQERLAVRTKDLFQALNEVDPHVVQFSGHGSQEVLVFEDDHGQSKPMGQDSLAAVLDAFGDSVRLVIFNSCSSAAQAVLATQHVALAIGMSVSISDDAAKEFSAHFYSALGFGLSVGDAFRQAKAAVGMTDEDELSTPVLHAAEGVDPDQVFLVQPPEISPAA